MSMPFQITPEDIVEGEDVDFEEVEEHWNVYKLKDGTTLKVKLVLIGVKRLKKYNPDGTPIYIINAQNIIRAVNIPKELKLKTKANSFKSDF
ncbi:MAG: hypothetical protein QXX09_04490 [Candidatus Methanomethylicia archaeon]